MNPAQEKQIFEELSALEHEQWLMWAKDILEKEDISEETRKRWEEYFVPYEVLPEGAKNLDRTFARKSLEVFKSFLEEK